MHCSWYLGGDGKSCVWSMKVMVALWRVSNSRAGWARERGWMERRWRRWVQDLCQPVRARDFQGCQWQIVVRLEEVRESGSLCVDKQRAGAVWVLCWELGPSSKLLYSST